MTTSYKACHKIVFQFLCHCITDFFVPIDIQLVLFVIYARFLYHYGITTLSLAIWIKIDTPLIYNCILIHYK
ncbi:hypothetical protein DW828_03605 [Parabacteroides merdae]|uniref:Uncharacterized protein n=1 Tax=Parabacteroides merdae TaxID=46503 RepID=A0A414C6G2_9BACT|nr:hypothetical protein DW828_03605 [Parabacteroides merdae]